MTTTGYELVAPPVHGNREALSELPDRLEDQVARRLGGKIGGQWRPVLDIEDVMQVTLVRAFVLVGPFTGSNTRAVWAFFFRKGEPGHYEAGGEIGNPQPSCLRTR